MATTVRKWGNSLGIRIPRSVAEQVALHDGAAVEFDTAGGVLTIRPRRRRRVSLSALLAAAKGLSPHRRLDRDPPVGREML